MKLFIRIDSLLELLLAHVTPWADSVADDLDVKLCHSAQCGPEHALKRNKERQALLVKVWTIDGVMYNEDGATKEQEGKEL